MNLTRRGSLSMLLSGIASTAAAQDQKPQEAAVAITCGPFLQCPTESTMTVTWITNRNTTAAVEYGPAGGELKTVFNSHHGLIDANERVHKVVLRDLKPGTVYRYRAVSRDIVDLRHFKVDYGETVNSEFRQFRTLDRKKADVSLLIFNDMHDVPETFSDMLKVAGSRPYDLVLLNGDIISYIENERQITAVLDQAVATFASTVPMVWVRGNHETRGRFARQFPGYLDSPNGRYYHSFDHGPIHFVVLDTGEDKVDSHREYGGLADFYSYRRQQGEWLKEEVKTEAFRRAKYRVVVCHMPFAALPKPHRAPVEEPNPFTGMAHAFDNFGGVLENAGVDLMISGHLHVPSIVEPELPRHSYPVIIGGGPKGSGRTLIRLSASAGSLDATILRPDGSVFGARSVKPKR